MVVTTSEATMQPRAYLSDRRMPTTRTNSVFAAFRSVSTWAYNAVITSLARARSSTGYPSNCSIRAPPPSRSTRD